jgi:hypothetical protein
LVAAARADEADADVLYALAAFYYHGQRFKEARIWADKLRQVQPVDARLAHLEQALGQRVLN